MRIIILSVLLSSLVLSSCARTSVSSATLAITATPTLNNKTIILTPDDVFALPGLKALSTPTSSDFCEHLPSPQIIVTPDGFSILSGRFVLCSHENWPWVINAAMDLDTGSLVPKDDKRADIVMENGLSRDEPSYSLVGWNNAYMNSAYVLEKYANHSGANHLSYEYCDNLLRDMTEQGVFLVEKGAIACVKTTEGEIALIRVEKIYPPTILSVEFSFMILRNE